MLFLGGINYNNFIFIFFILHKNNDVEASGGFRYDICMHELIYLTSLGYI